VGGDYYFFSLFLFLRCETELRVTVRSEGQHHRQREGDGIACCHLTVDDWVCNYFGCSLFVILLRLSGGMSGDASIGCAQNHEGAPIRISAAVFCPADFMEIF
jgi:hypothetical protein